MSREVATFLDRYPLPLDIDNTTGEYFDDYFNAYISQYSDSFGKISSKPVITHASTKVGILLSVEKNVIQNICGSLQQVLAVYLDGYPALAFSMFEKVLEESGLDKDLLKLNVLKIEKHKPFFRTQTNHESSLPPDGTYSWNSAVKTKDIFHAPFNKRKRVGTNRFSIPGYPCLYISDDLMTSFKECTQNGHASLNAICLRNNRPLYIADITPIDKYVIEQAKKEEDGFGVTAQLLTYIKIFPIVAACHMKVHYKPAYNNEVHFKVEYIIPQLLLQWFQKNAGLYIDGLRYLSCTAAASCSPTPYNYILSTNFKKGNVYCPKLSALLSGTDVISIGQPDPSKDLAVWLEEIQEALKSAIVKSLIP